MSPLTVLCTAVMLICGTLPGSARAQTAAAHPFDRIASVLLHPRCLNCHTVTEFPRQGDARLRHTQNVVRGKDGRGVTAVRCSSCHQSTNVGLVPGATNWHLAPLSMGWERMSNAQVCAVIKDPKKNGGRTAAELIEHMRSDALVLWAWNADANRQPPPLTHAEFISALEKWADAGTPCPK